MSAVVQIGSTILRSECNATFKVDWASAGAAKATLASSAQARRRPIFSMQPPRPLPVAATIGRYGALGAVERRLPVRKFPAGAAIRGTGRDFVLVDAMPA